MTLSVGPRLAIATFALVALAAWPACADVDSEHLFGFTEGTDIGAPFHPEGELEMVGRLGRSDGNYSATSLTAGLEYPLSEHFRLTPSITFTRFDISGVTDFEDRNVVSLEQLALEFRWRPFDRKTSVFGLAFSVTPFIAFVDEEAGTPGDSWGSSFLAAVDRALVADRLFVALNFEYEFGRARDYASGLIVDGSGMALSVAATARIGEGFYLGGEVRYLRAFDGMAFGNLVGQAVYVGPTFYAALGQGGLLSGAWNVQAWGQATGLDPGLDLAVFERNTFKIRLTVDF